MHSGPRVSSLRSAAPAAKVTALAFAALFAAAPLAAQASCDQVNPNADFVGNNIGLPNQTAIITGGRLVCPGGKSVAAREIATDASTGIYTLAGNVLYRDGERQVTADNGQWFRNQSIFQARGNVVVTDLKTGSRISAPALDYFQASSANPTARMTTLGGRGRVVVKRNSGSAAARRDSSIVDADIVEIIGESLFRGTGNAVITRTDLRGSANMVEYEQDRGSMLLAQNARLDGEDYDLTADTITAIAAEGEELREVRASRNTLLTSDEIRVESPFLRIYLDSGVVNRMVATRPAAARGAPPVSMPRVTSTSFIVSADSIDAIAPAQQLERVDAVGSAFAERLDTMPPPPAAREMPELLTNDWLRGSAIHARFIENPDARPDSAGRRERMMNQVIAIGAAERAPATSMLRMKQPNDTTWRIYYTLADTITVDFAKGEVSNTVLVNGRGVFLSPSGTAVADRNRRPGP